MAHAKRVAGLPATPLPTVVRPRAGPPKQVGWSARPRNYQRLAWLTLAALLAGPWFVCFALCLLMMAGRRGVEQAFSAVAR